MNYMEEAVIVEQTFQNSPEEVWMAITSLDQMQQWFFPNIESFKPEVGFETTFNVTVEDRNFLHLWKIIEVIPMKRITYNWKYGGYSGDSEVLFDLFNQNGLTTVKLSHQVIVPFPTGIAAFSRSSCLEGWNYFIKKRLVEYLS